MLYLYNMVYKNFKGCILCLAATDGGEAESQADADRDDAGQ